jgi:hypothetical protein
MDQIVAFKLKPPPAPEPDPELNGSDPFLVAREKRCREEYWDLANWRVSSKGNSYIVMSDTRCITVFRRFGAFSWSIAHDGWQSLWSQEFFPTEAAARRAAWETLAELI